MDLANFLNKVLIATFVAVCGFFTVKLFRYHLELVLFPWPIQYRETANLLSTALLAQGGNPYLFENQPGYTNVYGLLYSGVTSLLAPLPWAALTVHKAVGGFFSLCCSLLVYGMLRRDEVPRYLSWGGALVVYSALLFGKTSLAEPDSLGLFLYLLAITIPLVFCYSPVSLGASSVAGIAAFYAKPYFVLAIPVVGLYLLLFVSRRKGLTYLLLSTLTFTLTAVLVATFCEAYFYNIYLIHRIAADTDMNWMIQQWIRFGSYNRELLLAVLFAVWAALSTGRAKQDCRKTSPAAGHDMVSPRSPGCKISLSLFAVLAVSLVFSLKLGLHTGAYMTYLFQLVLPLLVLCLFPWLDRGGWWQFAIVPLIAAGLFHTTEGYRDIEADFRQFDRGHWQKASDYVANHRNILNSAAIAPLLFAQGKPVYDSGQSQYFGALMQQLPRESLLFPTPEQVRIRDIGFREKITSGIAEKRFDLLMLDRSFSNWLAPAALVAENYIRRDVLTLYMPHTKYLWHVDVWEPKK